MILKKMSVLYLFCVLLLILMTERSTILQLVLKTTCVDCLMKRKVKQLIAAWEYKDEERFISYKEDHFVSSAEYSSSQLAINTSVGIHYCGRT